MGKVKINDVFLDIGAYTPPRQEEYDCSICGNKEQCGTTVFPVCAGYHCTQYKSPEAVERDRIIQEGLEKIRKEKQEGIEKCRAIISELQNEEYSTESIHKIADVLDFLINEIK